MSQPIILLGAGGHARVLLDTLRCNGIEVLGYAGPEIASQAFDVEYLGGDECVQAFAVDEVALVNGVGNIGARQRLFDAFKARGYQFAQVIHPSAIVSTSASLGEGVQVMAGTVIQAGASLSENVIINTRASIDHDCCIGAHSHISVGAILAGDVRVGKRVLVGAGCTVIQRVGIADDCVAGAGAVVISDVAPGKTVVGVPAKEV